MAVCADGEGGGWLHCDDVGFRVRVFVSMNGSPPGSVARCMGVGDLARFRLRIDLKLLGRLGILYVERASSRVSGVGVW